MEPKIIALIAAVNQPPILQAEEKRVIRIVGVQTKALIGLFLTDAFTTVLNDARARHNLAGREHPIAVNLRQAHLVTFN